MGECLRKFNKILRRLIESIPKSVGTNRQYPCWYSKELIHLIIKKSRAKKKKKGGNESDIQKYKDLRHAVKKLITVCHDNYVANTEDNLRSNSKCFFSYTKSLRKTNSLPVNLRHGNLSAGGNVSACELFAQFFDSVCQSSGCLNDIFDADPTDQNWLRNITVSEDDFKMVLKSFDCNKVSSPDEIPMIFYVRLSETLSLPLSIIFNKSLE